MGMEKSNPQSKHNNPDNLKIDLARGIIQFVTQSSPASKMILFYMLAAVFCYFFDEKVLFICMTSIYALLIPILLVFMPERVWSEPTLIEWYRLGLGSKNNGNLEIQDAEVVQPISQQKQVSAKANIANPRIEDKKK